MPSQITIICVASNEDQLYQKLCENDDFLEYRPDAAQKFCSLDEVKQHLPTCSPSAVSRGSRPRLARFVAEFSSEQGARQVSKTIGKEQFGSDGTDRVIVVLGSGNVASAVEQQQGGNNIQNNVPAHPIVNRVAVAPVVSSTRRERSPERIQQQPQQPLFESVLGHQEQKLNLINNNWQQQQQIQFQHHNQQQHMFQQQHQQQQHHHHHQAQQQQQQQEASFKVFLGYQPTLQANPPAQQAVADCIKQSTGIAPRQIFVVAHKCAVFAHVGTKEEEDILLSKGTIMLAPHWKFIIKPAFTKKNENQQQNDALASSPTTSSNNPFSFNDNNNNLNKQQQQHSHVMIPAGFSGGGVQQQNQSRNAAMTNMNNNNNNNKFGQNGGNNQIYASSMISNQESNQTNHATSTILLTSLPSGTTEELLFYRLLPHEPSLIRMIDGTNCAAVTFENSEVSKNAMDFLQDKTLKGERLILRYV
jgi:hypothetical protein